MIERSAGSNGAAASIKAQDMTATRLLFFKSMIASNRVDYAWVETRSFPYSSSPATDGTGCATGASAHTERRMKANMFESCFSPHALIKRTVENFVNDPGCQRDQYQVSARLLPFVSIVTRQSADQPAIEFFCNSGGKRLAPREVFLNAGW
jgi:hypothetical protein